MVGYRGKQVAVGPGATPRWKRGGAGDLAALFLSLQTSRSVLHVHNGRNRIDEHDAELI